MEKFDSVVMCNPRPNRTGPMKSSITSCYGDDKGLELMHTLHLLAKCINYMLTSSSGKLILRSSSLSLILCETVQSHLIVFSVFDDAKLCIWSCLYER